MIEPYEEHSQHEIDLTKPVELPLDQNPAAVYLASLTSERSRRTMSNALRTVVSLLTYRPLEDVTQDHMLQMPWHGLRYQHTAAVRALLIDEYSPATVNRILSALRGVIKEAWRLGYISAEQYQRAVDIANVKAQTLPTGRELTAGEISALVETCKVDPSPAGIRDVAIIGLLYTCGLRRSELVAIEHRDFDPKEGRLMIRRGKGRKQRVVYVRGGALKALKDWIAMSPDHAGPIFTPVLKNGKIQFGGMVSQSIYDMLKKRGLQANVADFSPHDLRRTFVSDMLERGVDIATVADIAGHSSVDTTRRYDRRPEEGRKQAADRLHFPY
ncbi:MAG: site-specific integrase [Anaerolineae bacterium]|nr:site-specific integrase [Anaerolineae bacterium]